MYIGLCNDITKSYSPNPQSFDRNHDQCIIEQDTFELVNIDILE